MTSLRRRLLHQRREQQPFIVVNRPSRYGSEYPVRSHCAWWGFVVLAAVAIGVIIWQI